MVTKHLSKKEAWGSPTATRLHIDNTPNEEQLTALRLLAEKVFEPLREWYGQPILINSMFRSHALNIAAGGAKNSSHCKGEAMDIDTNNDNAILFDWIRENLDFDQLIWEFGDDINPDWIHVSYHAGGNRKQVMRAVRKGGRTIYSKL